MFICDTCGKASKPNQPCRHKVIETRPKEYIQTVIKGTEEKQYEKIYKSKGWEIVREQKICQACIDHEINKELLALGKDVYKEFDDSKGINVIPKRKHRDEEKSQFKIKLPYDVIPSNMMRSLEGLESWLKSK